MLFFGLPVIERTASEGCETGAEDHPGIGQVGIGNDTAGDQMLGTVDQRFGETGCQSRRWRTGSLFWALPSLQA